MPPGPGVPDGLVIPGAELDERFTRSSGPGGQGVNTTDSRVELRFDVQRSSAFTDTQRTRLLRVLGPRLRHGGLRLVATTRRSQAQNRAEARERLAEMLRSALAPPPPPRRATRPTLGSKNRRISAKKQRGETKAGRGRVRGED
ncbi:alternative ribosome rescue aminoacyl-tRNA hydrolase ArfB [Jatrophihabitans sp. YIM 134969]